MSVRALSHVWQHSQQKGGNLLVLLALADFADDEGVSWASASKIAEKSRLDERHARRILRELESAGEITVERRLRDNGSCTSSLFRVAPDKMSAQGVKPHPDVKPSRGKKTAPDKMSASGAGASPDPGVGDRGTLASTPPLDPSLEPSVEPQTTTAPQPALDGLDEIIVTPEQVYEAYPRKGDRQPALRAILRASRTAPLATLLARTKAYSAAMVGAEMRFIPLAATWFNAARYDDPPETWNVLSVRATHRALPPPPEPEPDDWWNRLLELGGPDAPIVERCRGKSWVEIGSVDQSTIRGALAQALITS